MSGMPSTRLAELQTRVASVVETTTKSELVQCACLLATYVALYKEQYGELTDPEYERLTARLTENIEFGATIYVTGMRELLATIALLGSRERRIGWLPDRSGAVN